MQTIKCEVIAIGSMIGVEMGLISLMRIGVHQNFVNVYVDLDLNIHIPPHIARQTRLLKQK